MNSMQVYPQPTRDASESSSPRFVSRIFSDACGRQFRLTFLVAVVNGQLRGQLVSAEPIAASIARLTGSAVGDTSICLPIACSDKEPATDYVNHFAPIVSPYTELYFFMSQPTRAPSFAC